MDDIRLIPLSALQHYVFCPRQCGLIHNAQVWSENWLTAQGQVLHQRVDQGGGETRKGVRCERGVWVSAPRLGLVGKLDLLEKDLASGVLLPVEYKRGKPKAHDADAVQLCSQALCLEEMTGQTVSRGALWYWEIRQRVGVELTSALRMRTMEVVAAVGAMLKTGVIPSATPGKGCRGCSLRECCQPDSLGHDTSTAYVSAMFAPLEDEG